eukprot:NODE_20368_length_801_cov_3.795252.p1 GENE.NODE_20368_length_801_cov_3.795252~~NODE_20368_length_801_cov_3.795252.p1  ORF type:complete len:185 (-),score=32.35 NODE_20368_length_801_cov_3.795252:245-799(-)
MRKMNTMALKANDNNRIIIFFQAEDGIRDLIRSSGLGNVNKRQRPLPGESAKFCAGAPTNERLVGVSEARPTKACAASASVSASGVSTSTSAPGGGVCRPPPPPPKKAAAPQASRAATLFIPTAVRTKKPVQVAGGALQATAASLNLETRNRLVATDTPRVSEAVSVDDAFKSFMKEVGRGHKS